MAMAMKPDKKKSKKPAASTAINPRSKSPTVSSNVELQSLPKEQDQGKPPQASTSRVRDTDRALKRARAQSEQQAMKAARTSSRMDTKSNLESITNDPTATPQFKDKLQQLDRDINAYQSDVKQANGKQLSKDETVVLLDKTDELLTEMKDAVKKAKHDLISGGGGGGGDGKKWYHRFLQWLHDKVSAIWNTLKESLTRIQQRLANIWELFLEWLRAMFFSKKTTPDDVVEPANTQV